jgi:hypothetical protein
MGAPDLVVEEVDTVSPRAVVGLLAALRETDFSDGTT